MTRRVGLIVALLAVLPPSAASAQLSSASAGELGLGGAPVANARGITAIRTNPAALVGGPSFSLSVVPLTLNSGLDPVSAAELSDWSGRTIPAAVRTDWLDRIGPAGTQAGRIDLGVSGFAVTFGNFGFQLSVAAGGRANLNQDAAELLLFGNAGRTGTPGDFDLAGSSMSGFALTTMAGSFALPVDDRLSIGLTAKYHVGNGFAVARDLGSSVSSNPVEVQLRFPTLLTGEDASGTDGGSGMGIDVGARLVDGPLTLAASIRNVVNTFEWDVATLRYRPGTALFDGSDSESDFEERPAAEAPQELRDAVADATLSPEIALGAAFDGFTDLRLTADVRNRFGDGLDLGPKFYAGIGGEWSGLGFLPVRAHLAKISEGVQYGGGLSLVLGPVHLSWGVAARTGNLDDSALAALSITFGSH